MTCAVNLNHKTLNWDFAMDMVLVPSVNTPVTIEVSGFEMAESSSHMIEWLGRGTDYRKFVVGDIEAEVYRQTPGAQVLFVRLNSALDLKTTARQQDAAKPSLVAVKTFSVTFPVSVTVRAVDRTLWKLEVQHNYVATGLDNAGTERRLSMNFGIVAH